MLWNSSHRAPNDTTETPHRMATPVYHCITIVNILTLSLMNFFRNLNPNCQIATKFCICHESTASIIYAKFCYKVDKNKTKFPSHPRCWFWCQPTAWKELMWWNFSTEITKRRLPFWLRITNDTLAAYATFSAHNFTALTHTNIRTMIQSCSSTLSNA